jgi:hypothetical protein
MFVVLRVIITLAVGGKVSSVEAFHVGTGSVAGPSTMGGSVTAIRLRNRGIVISRSSLMDTCRHRGLQRRPVASPPPNAMFGPSGEHRETETETDFRPSTGRRRRGRQPSVEELLVELNRRGIPYPPRGTRSDLEQRLYVWYRQQEQDEQPKQQTQQPENRQQQQQQQPSPPPLYSEFNSSSNPPIPIRELISRLQQGGARFAPNASRQDLETLLHQLDHANKSTPNKQNSNSNQMSDTHERQQRRSSSALKQPQSRTPSAISERRDNEKVHDSTQSLLSTEVNLFNNNRNTDRRTASTTWFQETETSVHEELDKIATTVGNPPSSTEMKNATSTPAATTTQGLDASPQSWNGQDDKSKDRDEKNIERNDTFWYRNDDRNVNDGQRSESAHSHDPITQNKISEDRFKNSGDANHDINSDKYVNRKWNRIRRQQRRTRRRQYNEHRRQRDDGTTALPTSSAFPTTSTTTAGTVLGRATRLGRRAATVVTRKASQWSRRAVDFVVTGLEEDEVDTKDTNGDDMRDETNLSNSASGRNRNRNFFQRRASSSSSTTQRRHNHIEVPDKSQQARVILVPGYTASTTTTNKTTVDRITRPSANSRNNFISNHSATNEANDRPGSSPPLDLVNAVITKSGAIGSGRTVRGNQNLGKIQDAIIEGFSQDPTVVSPLWRRGGVRKYSVKRRANDIGIGRGNSWASAVSAEQVSTPKKAKRGVPRVHDSSRRPSQESPPLQESHSKTVHDELPNPPTPQVPLLPPTMAENFPPNWSYKDTTTRPEIDGHEESYGKFQQEKERRRRQQQRQERRRRDEDPPSARRVTNTGKTSIDQQSQKKRIYSQYNSNGKDEDEKYMDTIERFGEMFANAADTFLWGSPSSDNIKDYNESGSKEPRYPSARDETRRRAATGRGRPMPRSREPAEDAPHRDGMPSTDRQVSNDRHWRDRMEEHFDALLGLHEDDKTYNRWSQQDELDKLEEAGYDAVSYAQGRSPKHRRRRDAPSAGFDKPFWHFTDDDDESSFLSNLFGSGKSRSSSVGTNSSLIGSHGSLLRLFHVVFRFTRKSSGKLVRWASVRGALPEPVVAIGLAAIGLSSPPRHRVVNVGLTLVAMRLAGEMLDGYHYDNFDREDGDLESVEQDDLKAPQ